MWRSAMPGFPTTTLTSDGNSIRAASVVIDAPSNVEDQSSRITPVPLGVANCSSA